MCYIFMDGGHNMKYVTLQYKVMGFGNWVSATVSHEIAKRLETEYNDYGWPTRILELDSKKAA